MESTDCRRCRQAAHLQTPTQRPARRRKHTGEAGGKTVRCTSCGKSGHNRSSCQEPVKLTTGNPNRNVQTGRGLDREDEICRMGQTEEHAWNIQSLTAYQSRKPDEIDWLWSANLPVSRDNNPAVWDSIIGFFEDAIVASCSRPGHLVITPRELLKQMKHNGREPASGKNVIDELFKRGDIVRADTLKPPGAKASSSASTFSTIRSTLSGYIWGRSVKDEASLDDPIVAVSALKAAATRANELGGPTASTDIHTVKTFARDITAGNTRDAEAVIAHMVSKGSAHSIHTDPPDSVLGVRVGASTTAADKGVLQTKAALERMEDTVAHLSVAVEIEQKQAKELALKGDKAAALAKLRKKKVLDAKLASARSAASKLGDVLMAVDEAESNKEAVSALEIGMASLKIATKDGVTADRIDAVAAEFDDALGEQQDVRLAFNQLNVEAEGADEELEGELAAMMREDAGAEEKAGTEGAQKAVDAAAAAADGSQKLVDEAEAELARLMAELPMPLSPERAKQDNSEHVEGEQEGAEQVQAG